MYNGAEPMKHTIATAIVLLFFRALPCNASQYQVVFETTQCDGSSGFSTVAVDSIYKIQEGDCTDPEAPDQKLKQLLVHNGSGSYVIYSLRVTEAREIMDEVKNYMKARRKALEETDTVIITE